MTFNSHHRPGDIHVGNGAKPTKGASSTGPNGATASTPTTTTINVSHASKEALENARRITEEKGITSPEARIAWELVEELAATDSHHKTTGQG